MFGDPFCRFRGLTASDFTSCATTAKPRPASPARAASIVAFNASRFVCATIRLNDADDLTYLIGLFRKTADRQRRMRGHARRIDNDAARASPDFLFQQSKPRVLRRRGRRYDVRGGFRGRTGGGLRPVPALRRNCLQTVGSERHLIGMKVHLVQRFAHGKAEIGDQRLELGAALRPPCAAVRSPSARPADQRDCRESIAQYGRAHRFRPYVRATDRLPAPRLWIASVSCVRGAVTRATSS